MSDDSMRNPHLILAVGTRVVLKMEVKGTDGRAVHPRGAVGVVIQSPSDYWHSYRIRFPDGFEAGFKRQDLAVLSQYKDDQIGAAEHPLQEFDLYEHVIFRCVVGSRAYGLSEDESDTDRRGIYLPPADMYWSLWGVPEQLENLETEETYWEIQKFVTLALKANPNILECLYTPLVEHASDLAREILDMRSSFLSKMVYQTYNGYVMSQFKKLQADLRNKGEVKWKHVMHLIRLLLSGVTVLKDGFVPVRVEEHRDRLLAIKRGEIPFDEVEKWRLKLHERFDEAFRTTKLPEKPDYEKANDLLLRARRSAVSLAGHSQNISRIAVQSALATSSDARLLRIVDEQPYPLIFATISGAHLYGFPSPDSDYDLRGVHVLPAREVVGIEPARETIEVSGIHEELEMDLVTHDLKKFIGLMLKKNGYVLEQLYSPLIVHTTPEHQKLKELGRGCITKHHAHHYFGFAETQWKLFAKESPRRVKPLLYVYRVLLTGIHLMKSGTIEANLLTLNDQYKLPYINDLVQRKLAGPEHAVLQDANMRFHQSEYERLRVELQKAFDESKLPETPSVQSDLNDLLIRVRLNQ